ncbi:hypothetical protein [Aureliella helgolandensis]|uniref:Uncharacterized protein n=1 Tax=Aureliella helgolandensis TaxID=2527968 RepID=A0A518GH82_9BACT|nr:hypothetical protein [Aureliella helgolandensis]QDV27955.1 hypothetical protein Q31a_63480 [Aureliella helgolandensis]
MAKALSFTGQCVAAVCLLAGTLGCQQFPPMTGYPPPVYPGQPAYQGQQGYGQQGYGQPDYGVQQLSAPSVYVPSAGSQPPSPPPGY